MLLMLLAYHPENKLSVHLLRAAISVVLSRYTELDNVWLLCHTSL
jgi:hypothetical protein